MNTISNALVQTLLANKIMIVDNDSSDGTRADTAALAREHRARRVLIDGAASIADGIVCCVKQDITAHA